MGNISLRNLFYITKKYEMLAVFGAGEMGKKVYSFLKNQGRTVDYFFDSKVKNIYVDGENICVCPICYIKNKKVLYIIAVNNDYARSEMRTQAIMAGVNDSNIVEYYEYRDGNYMRNLPEDKYEEEIKDLYFEAHGKEINMLNPKSYTEIINCDKLRMREHIRCTLADKYKVREWISKKIGDEYLTTLYGCWTDAREIDFDVLPSKFVLKANNGSGRNIIVIDKKSIDKEKIVMQLNGWMKSSHAYASLELQYRDIEPMIICEEYLPGVADEEYDYNIFCFGGQPVYIWCIKGSHRPNCVASFYDLNWKKQVFSFGYPIDEQLAPRPNGLEKMLKLTEILCKDFEHVRVDWYNLSSGRIVFGEMTFTSWSGLERFNPVEYDYVMGSYITKLRDGSRLHNE